MEHLDTLHTIAEIAVALAGFTGIVTIFSSRSGHWPPAEVLRLRTLLRASLSALFLCFVPILFSFLTPAPAQVWKASCLVIAAVMSINLVVFWSRSRPNHIRAIQKATLVGGFSVVIVLISASLGAAPDPALVVLFALLWQLFIAAQNFVLLLVAGISDES
ncbi:MAG: hypothetical protein JRG89_09240 [Deltaproteobacteria bacterium]|nr:hypothetical protein [Deltaproteobacteria bacterium]MBW2388610.1 hypothetical protein [Deltaproteobacteria bacterium]MBW2725838.1 hypothetical protein [Deltaproteobacteria bacterium]